MLGGLETVSDQVHLISFFREAVQRFRRPWKKQVARWQQFQEPDTHFPGQVFITDFEIQQRQRHSFRTQFVLADLSFSVFFPEPFVMQEVVAVKQLEIVHPAGRELEGIVKRFEGGPRICLEIPEGMIKVEKQVPIFVSGLQEKRLDLLSASY